MKALLINLFLSRGVAMATELLGKGVRHVMGVLGGALLASEYFTPADGDLVSIEGGLLALGALLLSGLRTFVAKQAQ